VALAIFGVKIQVIVNNVPYSSISGGFVIIFRLPAEAFQFLNRGFRAIARALAEASCYAETVYCNYAGKHKQNYYKYIFRFFFFHFSIPFCFFINYLLIFGFPAIASLRNSLTAMLIILSWVALSER
jgi:hypothetical protein